jgi:hypothetical protein
MTVSTDRAHAASPRVPHLDAFELPPNYTIKYRSSPRSKPRLIDTRSKHKEVEQPASGCLTPVTPTTTYVHTRIKRESNTKLYPLGARGTKYEIIRAIKDGVRGALVHSPSLSLTTSASHIRADHLIFI